MMRWKRFLLICAALLAALVVIPFLVPMESYTRRVEQTASATLGQPVAVGSLHLALLPTPRVNIGTLRIGGQDDIVVDSIAVIPELSSLLSDQKIISHVIVRRPVVRKSALNFIGAMPKAGSTAGPATVLVRRIVAHELQFQWEGMDFPLLNAEIALGGANQLHSAHLASTDGKFQADLIPRDMGYAIHLQARQWTPPAGPPVTLDTLAADLEYAGSALKVPKLDAALLQGRLSASGELDWTKNWRIAGNFNTRDIELGDATRLFSKAARITGRVSGRGTFSSNAKEASRLADALTLDYSFNVANGVLHGVDLTKAASLLVRQKQSGGETRFDALSGTLHLRGRQIEVRPLHLASGLLAADGNVRVAPDKKLGGKIDAQIKKDVALVTLPLEISGTTDSPMVMPTKAALAGAAAGTALMGPLGTNLGIKAGAALDKLFGGDKK